MSDTQENPHIKIAALQIQLQIAQEGQARIATSLAEANEQTRALIAENQRVAANLEQVNANNIKLLGQYQEKGAQVEEFREKLAEKIKEEVQLRERHDRVMLYFDHYARMIEARNGGGFVLPTPKGAPKRRNDPRIEPTLPLDQNIKLYDTLYANLSLKELRELLG